MTTTPQAPPAALTEPRRNVGPVWIGGITSAVLGLYMAFFTPIQVLLPLQLAAIDEDGKVAAFGLVTGVGALVAVIANPLAGALSDRTTGRFGRRHPWTLGGVLIGAAALALLGHQSTVLGVLVCWCLAQAALNAGYASVNAGIPDHVPVRQRAVVSGWIGFPQALGLVLGAVVVTVLVTDLAAGYLVIGLAAVALALPFVLSTPDPPLPRRARPPFSWRALLGAFWVSPRAHPDFAWAWFTRFLVMLGNAIGTLYLLFFLQDAVGYERLFPGRSADEGVLILVVLYTAGVVATSVVGGVVSDRIGRRKALVAASCAVMAFAALLLTFWHTWPAAIAAAAIMGAGFGVYLSVDQALITQVLPAATDRAKDLGIINIASTAPQVLGPALAAPVVAHFGGYGTLYALATVVTLLGGVLVWKIKSVP
ncbi:MFS transporter [Glycomyces harbinensis]|uniref:Major Facilitator Superfamily protein n=1 Tax=Glycomyces harbinensis TaxID=58114 RepID=A0A1G6R8J6_9ACTN|nr:MFS transporter [Glycomyces harbinensis]SDD00949.1 Major Facilitator Superfamily protein [Glycomyces harbinensis]